MIASKQDKISILTAQGFALLDHAEISSPIFLKTLKRFDTNMQAPVIVSMLEVESASSARHIEELINVRIDNASNSLWPVNKRVVN